MNHSQAATTLTNTDVNKRVSRLGANIPLIKHDLSPLSFIDMPEEPYFRGTQAVAAAGTNGPRRFPLALTA